MDTANAKSYGGSEASLLGDLPGWVAPSVLLLLVFLVIMGMIVLNKTEGAIEVETLTQIVFDRLRNFRRILAGNHTTVDFNRAFRRNNVDARSSFD